MVFGFLQAYCSRALPWLIGRMLMYFIIGTVNQDRQVWEHKMHVAPRNIVPGDGPFAGYNRWLGAFTLRARWDGTVPR